MSQLADKIWWEAAGIRALKTVAQTAIATIGTAALVTDVNWTAVVSAACVAGILSLLTSLAGLPEINAGQQIQTLETENKELRDEVQECDSDGSL